MNFGEFKARLLPNLVGNKIIISGHKERTPTEVHSTCLDLVKLSRLNSSGLLA